MLVCRGEGGETGERKRKGKKIFLSDILRGKGRVRLRPASGIKGETDWGGTSLDGKNKKVEQ